MSVPRDGREAVLRSAASEKSPRRQWALPQPLGFAFVSLAFAAFFIAAGAPTPLLPIYEREWMFPTSLLTVAFGVYAIGLLVSLLVLGRLSDYIGRKPVLIGSLALELVAMVLFLAARDIGWLIAARVVQGIATGAATSAFSAAIIELAPPRRKNLGTIISSVAAAGGLGLGALFAGALAQFDTAAQTTVWVALVIVMAGGTLIAVYVPETAVRAAGAARSLRPQIAIPRPVRHSFGVAVPAQLAAWMTAALFIGLMPTVLGTVFAIHSPFATGATSFMEPAVAAVSSLLVGRIPAWTVAIAGAAAVVVGAALVVLAIVISVLPVLWLGGVVGGFGFGSTLSSTVRLLVPDVEPGQRGGLFAAIYVVAYLGFGVPAIVAGLFIGTLGVTNVAAAFGVVIAAAGALGLVGRWRTGRPAAASTHSVAS